METLLVNQIGHIRRAKLNGRTHLVAPMTLIVPGVLPGSKGALYYPPNEIRDSVDRWNHTPIVVYHPTRNGLNVSARDPEVLDKQSIGLVLRTHYRDKLIAEGWIDEEAANRVDPRIVKSLEAGKPLELSTGLFTTNIPAPYGSHHNGRGYENTATDYRPDHLAILPDQIGACSIPDGCGVLVNTRSLLRVGDWIPVAVNSSQSDQTGPSYWSHSPTDLFNGPHPGKQGLSLSKRDDCHCGGDCKKCKAGKAKRLRVRGLASLNSSQWSPISNDSYFGKCKRDAKGHCMAGGGADAGGSEKQRWDADKAAQDDNAAKNQQLDSVQKSLSHRIKDALSKAAEVAGEVGSQGAHYAAKGAKVLGTGLNEIRKRYGDPGAIATAAIVGPMIVGGALLGGAAAGGAVAAGALGATAFNEARHQVGKFAAWAEGGSQAVAEQKSEHKYWEDHPFVALKDGLLSAAGGKTYEGEQISGYRRSQEFKSTTDRELGKRGIYNKAKNDKEAKEQDNEDDQQKPDSPTKQILDSSGMPLDNLVDSVYKMLQDFAKALGAESVNIKKNAIKLAYLKQLKQIPTPGQPDQTQQPPQQRDSASSKGGKPPMANQWEPIENTWSDAARKAAALARRAGSKIRSGVKKVGQVAEDYSGLAITGAGAVGAVAGLPVAMTAPYVLGGFAIDDYIERKKLRKRRATRKAAGEEETEEGANAPRGWFGKLILHQSSEWIPVDNYWSDEARAASLLARQKSAQAKSASGSLRYGYRGTVHGASKIIGRELGIGDLHERADDFAHRAVKVGTKGKDLERSTYHRFAADYHRKASDAHEDTAQALEHIVKTTKQSKWHRKWPFTGPGMSGARAGEFMEAAAAYRKVADLHSEAAAEHRGSVERKSDFTPIQRPDRPAPKQAIPRPTQVDKTVEFAFDGPGIPSGETSTMTGSDYKRKKKKKEPTTTVGEMRAERKARETAKKQAQDAFGAALVEAAKQAKATGGWEPITGNEANFRSEKQRKFMWSQHPDIAEKWAHGQPAGGPDSPHRMPSGPGPDVKGPQARAARKKKRKKKPTTNQWELLEVA